MSTSSADSEFWTGENEHQELAKMYEQAIEMVHPDRVSSKRMCAYCNKCPWAATTVKYYTYRGPRV